MLQQLWNLPFFEPPPLFWGKAFLKLVSGRLCSKNGVHMYQVHICITSVKAARLRGVTSCDPLLACLRACLGLAGLVQALPDEAVGGALPPRARDAGLSRVGASRRLQHRGSKMTCS